MTKAARAGPAKKTRAQAILRVAIDAPLARLFDYLPPSDIDPALLQPGCRVLVPFGRRRETALLMEMADHSELPKSKLRNALAIVDASPILQPHDLWLMRFTSDYYHHAIGEVVAAALPAQLRNGKALYPVVQQLALGESAADADLQTLRKRAKKQAALLDQLRGKSPMSFTELDTAVPGWRRVYKSMVDKGWLVEIESSETAISKPAPAAAEKGPVLNADQSLALAEIRKLNGFSVTLLHGVTGSGKTEVYLRLIADVLAAGKQVLVLVPEIGLTPQLVTRFSKRLGFEPAVLHSSLTDGERLDTWRAAADGSAPLIIGTRSAVFVPLKNPGLIIIDEEHDASLKQQEGLRYSARDLAVLRAKRFDVPIVLGTATPSLESLQRCREGAYRQVLLPTRAGNAVPPLMRLVDLSTSASDDGLSQNVLQSIRNTLSQRGQVLVFLNRRGFAPTLICTACSHIAECDRCDARLTVHVGKRQLVCHHCGAFRKLDTACSECGSAVKADSLSLPILRHPHHQ